LNLSVGRSALYLLARITQLWVRPTVLPIETAERLRARGRRVVYVLEERALSDLLALAIACRAKGLPPATARLELAGLRLPRATIYLEGRRGLIGARPDERVPARIAELYARAIARGDLELDLVPVTVCFGRAPGKDHSWLQVFFSEDWMLTGRFRRLLSTLVNGRTTMVHFGEPRALAELAGEHAEPRRAARRIALRLRLHFRNTRAAIVGPDLSHRRTVIREVLSARAVRAAVRAYAGERKIARHEALLIARRYAYEVAADYSHRFVTLMSFLLTRLWTRLYDGVEVLNGERLDALEPGAQIVYLPCHRSHFDYLLLSYVIYHRGLAVPHVAGGVNLNLPVLGRWLRKGGAFFLRRSFKGDALYPAVFLQYLAVMMARGHAIEYFMEGGRSRTGRLLPARTGLLGMTVRCFLADPRRPVVFMPVYFAYERLFEAKTYLGELSGRPKEKETLLGLLRALPKLRQRFGRVYVSFGEALPLAAVLDQQRPRWREQAGSLERPPWLAAVVGELALELERRVNAAAAVSPVALLGMALLATPRQALAEADLLRQIELYRRLHELSPYAPTAWCTPLSPEAIVAYGFGLGLLERHEHALGPVIRMSEANAVLAAYYRNNVLHLYALPSLIACAFLNNEAMRREDIQRLAWRIYPYIAAELFLRWPESALAALVDQLLEVLVALGLLARGAGERFARPAVGSAESVQLSLLAHTTLQVIERYYLLIALLVQAGSGTIGAQALELRCQQMASRMALLYELHSPEFFDRTLFTSFLELLRARAVIGTNEDGTLSFGAPLLNVAADARVVLSEQIRHSILQVTHS
jgi:glycerol-3-phosphate O-acyltransferase